MKFPQMTYKRVELEPALEKMQVLLDKFKGAKTAEEAFAAFKEVDDFNGYCDTMFSLGFIRHTLDTKDEFYDAEKDYIDETTPKLMPLKQEFTKALLASPFRKEFEAKWGTLMFDKAEMELKTFKPEIVPDLQEENKLVSEYDKLVASAEIEFDGKTLTLAQLGPYHEDPDRTVREASLRARADWFMQHAEKLDSIFDELVKVRTRMAKKLGYKSFTELGYYRMERLCYGGKEVDNFRQAVLSYIVPVVGRFKSEQAKRIGVETIRPYDDACLYLDGNAKPVGTPDDIFAHSKKMYHELSKDTAAFIDFMLEKELFDVLTRPGKASGGYCSYLQDYKSPFIFANFNGTSGDIDVLTHEAGHAFAAYEGRDIYPTALADYSADIAEIHSMAMEFFAWPWMEGFFGDATKKYLESHLASALTFLPYGSMVDDFQHRIYENPEMTPAQRNALWLEMEGKYRPYLDLKDFPFYGEGRRWQAQLHIFGYPFYYIDYCLAQTAALAFWAEDQENHQAAWDKYCRLVRLAGTKTFSDLLTDSQLASPFVPATLKNIADSVTKWLEK